MSTDEWDQAYRLFGQWPDVTVPDNASGTVRRLADALASVGTGGAGWRDIASLTRQLLVRSRLLGNNSPLLVPLVEGLPSREQWETALCMGGMYREGLRIYAEDWAPENEAGLTWEAAVDQVSWAVRGEWAPDARHEPAQVEADPFWKRTLGLPSYRSLGQRQIARSVVLSPPGSTTIACLPTGHGKTPVALAAALLASPSEGVSLLVVPTVILALDMERRVREMLAKRDPGAWVTRYAYVGSLTDQQKQEIRDAVAAGRRPIVIASPEGVKRGLRNALDAAASAGLLRYLVIDEAHLVEQWGNYFRSDFQTLAMQRRAWLRQAPVEHAVRTVAMSATLTDQQVRTLETLFGEPGSTEVLWASELRQEPAYFLHSYPNEASRQAAVLEAATLLPSPAIVYTTKKADANAWARQLQRQGMHRVTVVHGDSTEQARRDALEGWSGRDSSGRTIPTRYDIVIGTSAFGLGVDLADVRTVLHATVPETVDRYYQEVGRGGRDGNPCIAFLASTPSDRSLAVSLNKQRILTSELAWDRWHSMIINEVRAPLSEVPIGFHRVDLRTQRPDVPEDSERNLEWNIRVINLMARAELIDVRPPTPPMKDEAESWEVWSARQQAFYERSEGYVDLQFLDGNTNDEKSFKEAVRSSKQEIKSSQTQSLARMINILDLNACMAEVLSDYYTVRVRAGELTTAVACRGCPTCRQAGLPADGASALYRVPITPDPAIAPWKRSDDPLESLHRDGPSLSLFWRSYEEHDDELTRLLGLLAARGTAFFGGPGLSLPQAEAIQAGAGPHPVIYDGDGSCARDHDGTVVWVLKRDAEHMDETALVRYSGGDRLYLFHPSALKDYDRPHMFLQDIHAASIPLNQARKVL
ncbi:protein DpdF [Streptomyces phytophilus]|uniref:protein DpdF n=1 Tax=Streptomyces phytophilus TaxID=722715 RepID=UPI0015F0500A|nr:protein DpdF [Streptomyces phytophilus]